MVNEFQEIEEDKRASVETLPRKQSDDSPTEEEGTRTADLHYLLLFSTDGR